MSQGGAETNVSLRGNRAAFDELAFVPRVLVDVSARTTKTTLFGRTYDAPFGFAPMGGSFDGRVSGRYCACAHRGASQTFPMIMSGASLTRLEDVRAAGRTAWFLPTCPARPKRLRSWSAGSRAPVRYACPHRRCAVAANRENNVRSGFTAALRPTLRLAWDCALRPELAHGHVFAHAVCTRLYRTREHGRESSAHHAYR
jgi:L-lactate dehydrogenase (cytochrome)